MRTTAVLLAMGASYRRLGVPSLEALHGAGVYYGGTTSEAAGLVGRDVFIVGGANSAGQAALHLARYAKRVTLVVRAASLRAGMSEYLVRQVEATPTTSRCEPAPRSSAEAATSGSSTSSCATCRRASETTVEAQALVPHDRCPPVHRLAPADDRARQQGFVLTGPDVADGDVWPLERRPFLLETSMPGVFAAGDVRHGAVKRVASAVGEGSIAIQFVHQLLAIESRSPIRILSFHR